MKNVLPCEIIRFTVGICSLGSILIATSDKGICALFFGSDPNELIEDLKKYFPKAQLIDGKMECLLSEVVAFVERPAVKLNLPLDIRGTSFQQRVWQALREIPVGSTESYSQVAERIGAPQSVRAVASACARNKIAVAIPCHRVVRSDGNLSGYRWGSGLKKALIDREGELP